MDVLATNDIGSFVVTAGTPTEDTTAGRFDATYTNRAIFVPSGGTGQLVSGSFINPDTGAAVALTDGWLHFEMFSTAVAGAQFQLIELLNDVGVPVIRFYQFNASTVRVDYWNGAAWVTTGPTSAIQGGSSQKHTYDIHFVCGAAGSIELFGDQSSQFVMTGLNAAVTNVKSIRLNAAFQGNYYSQILVSDQNTVGAKVADLRPNSNSATNTAWANDFNNVVKVGYNDATLISSSAVGDKETYGATDASLPANYTISSVWFTARARLGSVAPVNAKPLVRIGGADYAGGYNMPGLNSAAFGAGYGAFTLDPSTGATWTLANANAAEIGFLSAA